MLLVAETLKGFPALLQIALPLLFVEGVRRFLLCAEAKEDLPAAPPLRYLRVAEVKRRVRRIWGGRTHASLRAGCGSRNLNGGEWIHSPPFKFAVVLNALNSNVRRASEKWIFRSSWATYN